MNILCSTTAKKVTDKGLVVVDKNGNETLLEADNVLLAAGMVADKEFVNSFANTDEKVYFAGDAIRPGRVVDATTVARFRMLDI